ncbi:MarR family transcriptional regulator [Tistrella sp. BH-R2-4]|uniref:MarR family transcriptional regulator n=1 Tax=Tistrella arctica TaxID=3133430 RepID=A0ABU9YP98_9PROT
MMMSGDMLQTNIGFLLASLNRQLERDLEENLRPMKLPVDQLRVLQTLAFDNTGEGLSMSELARAVLVDASTLTKVVDRMISDSLVYRAADPADRRRVKVLLTHKGASLLNTLRPLLHQQEQDLQKTFEVLMDARNPKDFAELLGHLYKRVADPQ